MQCVSALELRYQLIPYYYSLAHETYATGIPIMRPLVMEFPDDPRVANMSDEWLMGRSAIGSTDSPAGRETFCISPERRLVCISNKSIC